MAPSATIILFSVQYTCMWGGGGKWGGEEGGGWGDEGGAGDRGWGDLSTLTKFTIW